MISKSLIKHISSLHHGKFRKEHREFIAEGVKLAEELLQSQFVPTLVCASITWIEQHQTLIDGLNAEIIAVSPAELERISALTTPNQVLVVFKQKEEIPIPSLAADELVLVLEDLRDPGNLGTIIRIADWFGIQKIICSPETVEVYNPKTVQATMGSLARVDVFYTELLPFVKSVGSTHPIYATILEGEDITKTELSKGGLIMIGSESHGLSETLISQAAKRVTLPAYQQHSQTGAESLNASVATALMCYEFRRRL